MSIRSETNNIMEKFSQAAEHDGLFKINRKKVDYFERGIYGCLYAKPTNRMQSALGIDKEVLVIVSTFTDQQPRTIQFARNEIAGADGRFEPSMIIVIHNDHKGNIKLPKWGSEQGITVLPISICELEQIGNSVSSLDSILCAELYSHDPFDVTGPVSDDQNFFGRREDAKDLARKLQKGEIRSCLGIRKVGKTSIINRIVREIRLRHDCITVMMDCSGDDIWSMTAAQLIASMSDAVRRARSSEGYATISFLGKDADIAIACKKLTEELSGCDVPLVFIFDEVDYITPGSPTDRRWRTEFNVFWRNLRRVYQEADREDRRVSILVSGVSSYWFSVDVIEGVENSALSFIPEEYISPMPRGATIAMLKNFSRVAGLVFEKDALEEIAEASGDMPYWARKACSYIHRQIPTSGRPKNVSKEQIRPMIADFILKEGVAIAGVAISHLFRVHPLLKEAVWHCYDGNQDRVSPGLKSTLIRYGILTIRNEISGSMMRQALQSLRRELVDAERQEVDREESRNELELGVSEWAEELAAVNRRRNLLERKLRGIVLNFIRADFLAHKSGGSISDRVVGTVSTAERSKIEHLSAEDKINKLNWLQLTQLVEREWVLLEAIFHDKRAFAQHSDVLNIRFDAHAKDADKLDLWTYRRSLSFMEDKLATVE